MSDGSLPIKSGWLGSWELGVGESRANRLSLNGPYCFEIPLDLLESRVGH